MKRLGVLGWPVAHSRSPAMQNAALSALGLSDWHYQRLPVPPALFEETVRALPGQGFAGANATIPHKRAALELADSASEAARAIGAANTLAFTSGGAIAADNTDAPGLIAALGFAPHGRRALVLGAGGSARAVDLGAARGGGERGLRVEPHGGARDRARERVRGARGRLRGARGRADQLHLGGPHRCARITAAGPKRRQCGQSDPTLGH